MVDRNKYSFEINGDVSNAISIYEYGEDKGLSKTDSQKIQEKIDENDNVENSEVTFNGSLEKPKGSGNISPVQSPLNNNI